VPHKAADIAFEGMFDSAPHAHATPTPSPSIIAVNKGGIEVQLRVDSVFGEAEESEEATFTLTTANNNPSVVDNYSFQAAVTKAHQIELLPASGARLEPNAQSSITQTARVRRLSRGQALRLRIKINYTIDGSPHTIQQDVNKVPGL